MSEPTPAPDCPVCQTKLERLFMPRDAKGTLALIGLCMHCTAALWRCKPPKAVTEAEMRQFKDVERRAIHWVQKALRDHIEARLN